MTPFKVQGSRFKVQGSPKFLARCRLTLRGLQRLRLRKWPLVLKPETFNLQP
jgi:hypothetical protein